MGHLGGTNGRWMIRPGIPWLFFGCYCIFAACKKIAEICLGVTFSDAVNQHGRAHQVENAGGHQAHVWAPAARAMSLTLVCAECGQLNTRQRCLGRGCAARNSANFLRRAVRLMIVVVRFRLGDDVEVFFSCVCSASRAVLTPLASHASDHKLTVRGVEHTLDGARWLKIAGRERTLQMLKNADNTRAMQR